MKYLHDESKWPVWANETIDIVEPDPNWIEKGYEEKALLFNFLSDFGIKEI